MKDTRRRWLLERLQRYEPFDATEAQMLARLIAFVMAQENCFDRRQPAGHVVASAWIVSPDRKQALLVRHRTLGKWLQPGGHVENDPSLIDAARRELVEETGLKKFRLLSGEIFDVDVHTIPARGRDPEHPHYDIRFVFEASPHAALRASEESRELRWTPIKQISSLNASASITRMARKTRLLR